MGRERNVFDIAEGKAKALNQEETQIRLASA